MNLDSYIAAIQSKSDHITETSIDLGGVGATSRSNSHQAFGVDHTGTLLERLLSVQALAETDVLEYGCNLYWNSGVRLGKLRKGEKTSVGLHTTTAVAKPGYLGDFHVHPYKLKGSPDATIGPSWGDIEGWIDAWSHRVGLFIVFAGKALCISIFRDCTKAFADHKGGRLYTQMDYQRANDHGRQLLGAQTFDQGIMDYQQLEQLGRHMDSVNKERELWNKVPTYPREFSEANQELNKEVATALRYEYFIADTSISPVVAALVSERVYKPSANCIIL